MTLILTKIKNSFFAKFLPKIKNSYIKFNYILIYNIKFNYILIYNKFTTYILYYYTNQPNDVTILMDKAIPKTFPMSKVIYNYIGTSKMQIFFTILLLCIFPFLAAFLRVFDGIVQMRI